MLSSREERVNLFRLLTKVNHDHLPTRPPTVGMVRHIDAEKHGLIPKERKALLELAQVLAFDLAYNNVNYQG